MMKHLKILDWASLALAFGMLVCLGNWPYDYYTLVRYAAMVILGAQGIRYYNAQKHELAYTFAALALLFQPIFKIALSKGVWNVIDVVVAVLLCITIFGNKEEK